VTRPLFGSMMVLTLSCAAPSLAECEYDLSAFTAGCVPGSTVSPQRITDEGWVIGSYYQCGTINLRGFLWTPKDGFIDLPPTPGYKEATPRSVADDGTVVGYVVKHPSGIGRACLWHDGIAELMPDIPNDGSKAAGQATDGTVYGQTLGWTEPVQCIAWLNGRELPMPKQLIPTSFTSDKYRYVSSNDWVCGERIVSQAGGDFVFRMRGDIFEAV
jgi:hypothetical protein